MKKIQKHIEIVRSPIMTLSSMSLKSCTALFKLLDKHYYSVGVTEISNLEDLEQVVSLQPDLVFIGLKYVLDEEGSKVWVSEFLEDHNIKHTGSGPEAIKLEQDKVRAKMYVARDGYNTSSFTVIAPEQNIASLVSNLNFPLFVKPTNMGAGKGIDEQSVVNNLKELTKKVMSLHNQYDCDALIEEYLPGREFTIAVLKNHHNDNYLAMPIEMHPGVDSNGHNVISYAVKSGPIETLVSAVRDKVLKSELSKLAIGVFKSLGANNYGRIDVRLNDQGVAHFLEANLIPSLIENSGNFLKACQLNRSLDYETVILQIVNLGLNDLNFKTADLAEPTNRMHFESIPTF